MKMSRKDKINILRTDSRFVARGYEYLLPWNVDKEDATLTAEYNKRFRKPIPSELFEQEAKGWYKWLVAQHKIINIPEPRRVFYA